MSTRVKVVVQRMADNVPGGQYIGELDAYVAPGDGLRQLPQGTQKSVYYERLPYRGRR